MPCVMSRNRSVKRKKEEWWIIIGDEKNDVLLGIKRVQLMKKGVLKKKIKIVVPEMYAEMKGEEEVVWKMYVVSDCYRGCDEQRELKIM